MGLGISHLEMARAKVEPVKHLKAAVELLMEAARLFKQQGDYNYVRAQQLRAAAFEGLSGADTR